MLLLIFLFILYLNSFLSTLDFECIMYVFVIYVEIYPSIVLKYLNVVKYKLYNSIIKNFIILSKYHFVRAVL